jgi:hypothetical protein
LVAVLAVVLSQFFERERAVTGDGRAGGGSDACIRAADGRLQLPVDRSSDHGKPENRAEERRYEDAPSHRSRSGLEGLVVIIGCIEA